MKTASVCGKKMEACHWPPCACVRLLARQGVIWCIVIGGCYLVSGLLVSQGWSGGCHLRPSFVRILLSRAIQVIRRLAVQTLSLSCGCRVDTKLRDGLVQLREGEAAIKFERQISEGVKCKWVCGQGQKYIQQTLPGFFPKVSSTYRQLVMDLCSGATSVVATRVHKPITRSSLFRYFGSEVLSMRRSEVGFKNNLLT